MNEFSHIELNEKKLAEETLQYILNSQNTYLECMLYHEILDPRVKYGDLNQHKDFLKERLSHLEFFVDYTDVTFENKVYKYHQLKVIDGYTVEDSGVLVDLRFKVEEFSKEIFWANSEMEQDYQKICHFKCFEEKLIPQAKMHSAFVKGDFFNSDGWIQYYQDLLDLKFPDFCEQLVSGKKIIKYKSFRDNYYLGVETDYLSSKKNFKKGNWQEPDYKLIIFRKLKGIKIDRVVVFDKFVHPFFNPPTFSFEQYSYVKNSIKISDLEFSFKYFIEREFLDNDMVRLYWSEEFGEHLKRHAYFYYDMLYHTTKEFIKFVEESFEPETNENY